MLNAKRRDTVSLPMRFNISSIDLVINNEEKFNVEDYKSKFFN